MNTTTPSLTAQQIIENIQKTKGFYVMVKWKSTQLPKAAFKEHKLENRTSAICRAGIQYQNLQEVKEAVANGERGEVQSLPWGEWKKYPYTIEHKNKEYYRLYPTKSRNQKPNVKYFVDNKEVDKEEYASYLTPSKAKELWEPKEKLCFNIATENILGTEEFEGDLFDEDVNKH